MSRLHIAHLGLKGIPATYGGVERVTEEIATRLVQRGYRVTVYSRRHYTPELQGYKGIDVVRLPSLNQKYSDTLSHTFLGILDAARRGVDVVHLHSLGPAMLVPLARLFRLPVVVHLHGQEWKGGKWGSLARLGFRAAELPAIYGSNETVVLSDELRRYYLEKFGRRTTRIPNGVDVPTGAREPNAAQQLTGFASGSYLLFVGRLVQEKGLEYLLEAHSRLPTMVPLVLAGEPMHSERYAAQLKAAWSSDRVRFVGGVYGAALSQLFLHSRGYIQPSIREGMSMSLLEAMAHGCRIVASDIPANREVLDNCGVCVAPRSTDALEAALQRVASRPEELDAMALAGRRRALDVFQWERVVDQWEGVYARASSGSMA